MKIKEEHTWQCDVCDATFKSESNSIPFGWDIATLKYYWSASPKKFLVCPIHKERRSVFKSFWKRITK